MVFGQNALAEDRHRRADRLVAVELDRECVHRDRSDHVPQLAADPHLGPGEVTSEAVAVANGHDADPGRLLCYEPAPVAGALARLEPLHLREITPPRERGLQSVGARILAERREPIQRDSAASSIEARRGQAQGSRAVGDVPHQIGVRLGCRPEALDLLLGEDRVGVGGGQVRH